MGPDTADASLLLSCSFGSPAVKCPTMLICSYFTVKQRDLPELEMVVSSSVAEVVRTEVKRTIGVKCSTIDNTIRVRAKRATRIHILYYKYSAYM